MKLDLGKLGTGRIALWFGVITTVVTCSVVLLFQHSLSAGPPLDSKTDQQTASPAPSVWHRVIKHQPGGGQDQQGGVANDSTALDQGTNGRNDVRFLRPVLAPENSGLSTTSPQSDDSPENRIQLVVPAMHEYPIPNAPAKSSRRSSIKLLSSSNSKDKSKTQNGAAAKSPEKGNSVEPNKLSSRRSAAKPSGDKSAGDQKMAKTPYADIYKSLSSSRRKKPSVSNPTADTAVSTPAVTQPDAPAEQTAATPAKPAEVKEELSQTKPLVPDDLRKFYEATRSVVAKRLSGDPAGAESEQSAKEQSLAGSPLEKPQSENPEATPSDLEKSAAEAKAAAQSAAAAIADVQQPEKDDSPAETAKPVSPIVNKPTAPAPAVRVGAKPQIVEAPKGEVQPPAVAQKQPNLSEKVNPPIEPRQDAVPPAVSVSTPPKELVSFRKPKPNGAAEAADKTTPKDGFETIDHLHKRGLVPFEPVAQVVPGADPLAQQDPHEPELFEVLGPSGELNVTMRRSKVLRCKENVFRLAVADDRVCDVVQFTPREVSIVGRAVGATDVTFWFVGEDQRPVTYLVRVTPDPELQKTREHEYQILEQVLAEQFPDSKVYLVPVADKLIVKGQARDAEEASQILSIIRSEAADYTSRFGRIVAGPAASPIPGGGATGNAMVINMLRIPGVQQVALRVKIAELSRSAARQTGLNLDIATQFSQGALLMQTLLNSGTSTSIIANFSDFDVDLGLNWLKSHGVIRILSEPTLVTMSGRSASFHAGGQFAVPTTVGVSGVGAITTSYKNVGVSLNFLPVVLDKDRMRLEVSPSFSQLDSNFDSGNNPGLTSREVTTTVEMREGQTLAIAGLLEDTMQSGSVSDFPFLPRFLGKRDVTRSETELIILVTPELVHPMEPEAVPPLPGFDVTEPTDREFYMRGHIEGISTHEHRATVWPRLRRRYRAGGEEMISGPFGHGQ
ncbi:MAG: pilus assembly protein N-terminal domain-containing protein [Pirellulales bacterium]